MKDCEVLPKWGRNCIGNFTVLLMDFFLGDVTMVDLLFLTSVALCAKGWTTFQDPTPSEPLIAPLCVWPYLGPSKLLKYFFKNNPNTKNVTKINCSLKWWFPNFAVTYLSLWLPPVCLVNGLICDIFFSVTNKISCDHLHSRACEVTPDCS